ncbi:MAG: hypothetical protein ASARMPREDX12_005276 [Alectoria sarmentosa]|nr:MAG: hypothetical protein ASARMPREDX12_005276 [Alectoria sarmentosa]
MQPSGGSTSVKSLAHTQSIDSGLGTDAFSLINANPEVSETSDLDLDAIRNMALPLNSDRPSSENPPPVRSTVGDWVQKQSQHDQPSNNTTGLQRAYVDKTPPRAGQAKPPRAQTHDHASRQEGYPPAKVYDIATLLRLRETQSAVPVMLRVKPEAIAENIFQYMGAATSRQLPTRSRGLSDASNISSGIATRPRYMTQPFRQPQAPPETSLLQRHDGFARFLKQHASPPHHRVTAGGRIVPAGPSSPPPMLDFGSLNGLLRDGPVTAKSFQKESNSAQSNPRVQNPQATSPMTLGDYLQSQGDSVGSMSLRHAAQPDSMQTTIPFNNLPFGYQPFMAPAMQAQAPLVPLAVFPDGSTLVSYNGMSYRASWNGMNTTMEPLQPLQLPGDLQSYPQAYPQGYFTSSHYGVVPQPPQASISSIPLASATNVARPDFSKVDVSLQNQAQNGDELSLKTNLTNLDKHLALYHYDITPADRASLVAQRRRLVEEIDRIRLSKEKPKHSIPIISPAATGLPVAPAMQFISGPTGLREAQNDRMAKGGTISKHLSPAAPAFVPRNNSNLPSTSFGIHAASQQVKNERSGVRASSGGIDFAPNAQDSAKFSNWTSHSDHNDSFPKSQRTSYNEQSSSSSVLDPSDPAMRVIDYEDIEYAARYLYNGTKDTKAYCTTVAEFQEAVRRVREQARLYGCAGGQSKDPAYDAEQDLWWAICDRDPIPLPSQVPDHVTNPRRWNWNDSAFNYRRQGANDNPVPGCDQARNSPRVVGWDPATTDKMKDVMDVSRSYFALKGQLPSVSFRDFTYDRDGKKRLIQSDTAAPAAYAPTLEGTAYRGHSPMAGSQRKELGSRVNLNGLKEMSTSELNIQQSGSALNAQSDPGDTGKDLEAASLPQEVPCTPEHRRFQRPFEVSNAHQASKARLSSGNWINKSKNVETARDPHHAYIEDYPETPVVKAAGSASRRVLTVPIKTTPSQAPMDLLPTGIVDARKGSPTPAKFLDCTLFPNSNWKEKEEELNSIWYHTPLDEVTQKYIDDMKSYNPFKSRQADGDNHGPGAAKDHPQPSDSSEPVTESKSPWGPEEGTTPTTPSGINRFGSLETHARVQEREMAKTAKVNIPSVTPLRAPIARIHGNYPFSKILDAHNTLDSREVKAVNVPSIESVDTHNFLRKMLKSPRYSSAQPTSILSQVSSTLADRINRTKRAQVDSTKQQSENKGNIASYKYGKASIVASGPHANNRPPSSASLARRNPNLAVSKALSSLASSTYQAHGYLPQFDGAGKAHTSSVYREQGIQPLPQVRLPSEALCGDKQTAHEIANYQIHGPSASTASTTYHNPVNLGYDGGRDSPPPKTTDVPKHKQSSRPAFDSMGVTLADFDNQREDTNNAWHHGAVEDFFQDLREQELQTIASHQRGNTQSAA